ncbi:MAG: PstC family ABC transporter permease, partial [Pseudobdellovibrionaceae bacterium]
MAKRSSRKLAEFTAANHPVRRLRRFKEKTIEFLLFLAAGSSVLVTLGIVGILVAESVPFFTHVSIKDFLTDTQWTPLFENAHYGILPLLCGTFLSTLIAVVVAIPLGTVAAAFLSEYVAPGLREILKP